MYRSIMVPLDGSPFSEQALPFARSIVRGSGAHLDLVHVHTLPFTFYSADVAPIFDQQEDTRQRANERTYLEGLAQRPRDETAQDVAVTVLDEPVASALAEYATTTATDLMVLTTHGRGALSRFWLGNVIDTLVHQLPVPLLLIRPTETITEVPRDPGFTHVLIPLDGSVLAEDILDHALALGSLTHAHYTLVQAVEPILITYTSPPAVVYADEPLIQQVRTNAQTYLDQMAERLRAQSIVVDTAVVIGLPAQTILAYAQQHDVDLIAMGTHGRGGFKRLLLGSVADKVVRGAGVPILLHHPARDVDGHEERAESERHEVERVRV